MAQTPVSAFKRHVRRLRVAERNGQAAIKEMESSLKRLQRTLLSRVENEGNGPSAKPMTAKALRRGYATPSG